MNNQTVSTRQARGAVLRCVQSALVVSVLSAGMITAPSFATEPGSTAAPFALPGLNRQVKLEDFRGKLVYLDFWASWCGPCRRSFPWMNDMQSRYGAQGLQIVGLNVDANRADAVGFLEAVPAMFTVGFDPEGAVAATYGIKGMPSSILIGPDGKVVAMHAGFNDADKLQLERLIKQNLPVAAK